MPKHFANNKVMDSYNTTSSEPNYQRNQKELLIDYVLVYSIADKKKDKGSESDKEQGSTDAKSKKKSAARKIYLENLKSTGLIIDKVKHDKHNYILIHTPFNKLLEIAEKTKLKLPIELNDLDKGYENTLYKCFSGISHKFELPSEIGVDNSTKFFTAPYSSTLHNKFQKFFNEDLDKAITTKDRCILTYEILCRANFSRYVDDSISTSDMTSKEASRIGIERLLANGTFQAAYPLHEFLDRSLDVSNENPANLSQRQILWSYWAKPSQIFKYQPLHLIREYFGEKLAFYFAWLGFYTNWLFISGFIGFFTLVYGAIAVAFDKPTLEICDRNGIGNFTMCPLCTADYCLEWKLYETCFYSRMTFLFDNPATIVFAVVIAVWSVFFIEFWTRKQSELQFEWDTEDLDKNVQLVRPQFELNVKKTRKNPITGIEEPYVSYSEKLWRYLLSFSAVIFMTSLVLAFLFGVIVYRVILKSVLYSFASTRAFSSTIISVTAAAINLVIILILGKFYSWLAVKLTDLENHRTDLEYEDSLTIKMYMFQFVNLYGSVFYVAFFKGRNISSNIGEYDLAEQCEPSGCLTELTIQLVIIMIGKQFLNSITEIFIPLLLNKIKQFSDRKEYKTFPQWAKDNSLINWTNLTLFDEYLEMVIQFGFMTLFTVAFPLGPLFALINNIIEIRIDAFKILTQLKRPLPKKAQSIGIWLPILNAIARFGVITNAFIIAFTSDFIPRFVYQFFYNEGMLRGYTNFTLSIRNLTEFRPNSTTELCYYRDFREPYNSPNKYEYTEVYWVIVCARLAFVVIFEHVVFAVLTMVHFLIPDVPKEVQDQIEREKYIIQKAIWEVDPGLLDKVRNESALDGNVNSGSDDDVQIGGRKGGMSWRKNTNNDLRRRNLPTSDDDDNDDRDVYSNKRTHRNDGFNYEEEMSV